MLNAPVLGHMTRDPLSVGLDASLDVARAAMDGARISALPVVDEHRHAVGVVSRSDLLRVGSARRGLRPSRLLELPDVPVGSAMSHQIVTVAPSTSLAEAAQLMVDRHIHHVYVEAKRELVGVLSTTDVIRAVARSRLPIPLSALMRRPVVCIPVDTPLSLALAELESHDVTGLAVLEDDEPVGMFTREVAMNARDLPDETPVSDVMSMRFVVALASTPVHRAAARAIELDVRHVLVRDDSCTTIGGRCRCAIVGVVTGMDMAGAAMLF